MMRSLLITLYRYGVASETNKAALQAALDTAVADILEGKGKDLISAAGNGQSYSFASGNLSISDFARVLGSVLQMIENNQTPATVAYGRYN